jgi:hypothetical protein
MVAYVQRKGTLRSWIKDNKAKDPNWVEPWNKKDETAQQVTVYKMDLSHSYSNS